MASDAVADFVGAHGDAFDLLEFAEEIHGTKSPAGYLVDRAKLLNVTDIDETTLSRARAVALSARPKTQKSANVTGNVTGTAFEGPVGEGRPCRISVAPALAHMDAAFPIDGEGSFYPPYWWLNCRT